MHFPHQKNSFSNSNDEENYSSNEGDEDSDLTGKWNLSFKSKTKTNNSKFLTDINRNNMNFPNVASATRKPNNIISSVRGGSSDSHDNNGQLFSNAPSSYCSVLISSLLLIILSCINLIT